MTDIRSKTLQKKKAKCLEIAKERYAIARNVTDEGNIGHKTSSTSALSTALAESASMSIFSDEVMGGKNFCFLYLHKRTLMMARRVTMMSRVEEKGEVAPSMRNLHVYRTQVKAVVPVQASRGNIEVMVSFRPRVGFGEIVMNRDT